MTWKFTFWRFLGSSILRSVCCYLLKWKPQMPSGLLVSPGTRICSASVQMGCCCSRTAVGLLLLTVIATEAVGGSAFFVNRLQIRGSANRSSRPLFWKMMTGSHWLWFGQDMAANPAARTLRSLGTKLLLQVVIRMCKPSPLHKPPRCTRKGGSEGSPGPP